MEDVPSWDDEMIDVQGRSSPDTMTHAGQDVEHLPESDHVHLGPAKPEIEMEART